jgi:pyruvate dehydrogenase E2 component (dihydrolipoamide acetyltransferase)
MAIEITVPRLGWSMDEGTFSAWLKQDGEPVQVGERLFTLESEKAAQEIEALDAGILRIPPDAPKPGGTVKVGQVLGYLLAAGESLPSAPAMAPVPTPSAAKEAVPSPGSRPEPASAAQAPVTPRARRAAADLGVKLANLQGTGKGGRIRERDVLQTPPTLPASTTGPGREIPVTPLRRTIADRMVQSRRETAPVTLTCRADATNLVSLRQQFKASTADAAVPSYTDIIIKIAASALQGHPALAGRWEGERIVLPGAIHIGIAVDTEHGLLVPVIRNVPDLALHELAAQSNALVEAARARRLTSDQLQGGTFTVTNLGSFGIEAFTPIINVPETAVLGLGAIRREPVVLDDGRLDSREQMMLSLTFDHRVVDGAPAARFLQTLRQGVENPAAWLLNPPLPGI